VSPNAAHDITALLVDWSNGDQAALDRLTPLVYQELRRMASRQLHRERADHTLQTTALVHEAYLRLVDQRRVNWRNSAHFAALAAQMMRRILIDHARKHRYAKRGGGAARVSLEDAPEIGVSDEPDVLEVDEALNQLAEVEPDLARIVELRYFGGLTSDQIAEVVGVSVPTVTRRWRMARAWLYRYLTGDTLDES
jgi:RNA polymerase sigma factor (TIGR02999 family)